MGGWTDRQGHRRYDWLIDRAVAIQAIQAFALKDPYLGEVVVQEAAECLSCPDLRWYDEDRGGFVVLLIEGSMRARAGSFRLLGFALVSMRTADPGVGRYAKVDAYGVMSRSRIKEQTGLGSLLIREVGRVLGCARWQADALTGTVASSNVRSFRAMNSGVRLLGGWRTGALVHSSGGESLFGRDEHPRDGWIYTNVEVVIPRGNRATVYTSAAAREAVEGDGGGFNQVWFFRGRPSQQQLAQTGSGLMWTWRLASGEMDVVCSLPRGEHYKLRSVMGKPATRTIIAYARG